MKTRIVAGHKITLENGKTYIATRPMASRGVKIFPVNIYDITESGFNFNKQSEMTIKGLDYEKANKLLSAFNNGLISFEGRTW